MNAKAPQNGAPVRVTREDLLEVCGDELRHLEHGHLCLATENYFQLFVREDVALVCRILQVLALYVRPELLYDLTAGHRTLAYDCLEIR